MASNARQWKYAEDFMRKQISDRLQVDDSRLRSIESGEDFRDLGYEILQRESKRRREDRIKGRAKNQPSTIEDVAQVAEALAGRSTRQSKTAQVFARNPLLRGYRIASALKRLEPRYRLLVYIFLFSLGLIKDGFDVVGRCKFFLKLIGL